MAREEEAQLRATEVGKTQTTAAEEESTKTQNVEA
jgi:hypothetical protein